MTRSQQYYAKHKNDPGFMEKRREYQRNRRANNPEYKKYLKKYAKKYYKKNHEALKEKRRSYPDKTRNERVSKFRKKEAMELKKNYIIRLLTRHGKFTKEEITPAMIRKKREQIRKFREQKLLRSE